MVALNFVMRPRAMPFSILIFAAPNTINDYIILVYRAFVLAWRQLFSKSSNWCQSVLWYIHIHKYIHPFFNYITVTNASLCSEVAVLSYFIWTSKCWNSRCTPHRTAILLHQIFQPLQSYEHVSLTFFSQNGKGIIREHMHSMIVVHLSRAQPTFCTGSW